MDVDADQVDERTRPHGPACPVRQRLVEVLGAHPRLVQHAHAVVEERDQDPVDDEAGRVVAADGLLARALCPFVGRIDGFVRRLLGPHDLDERQQRCRVEEVHADHALRTLGRLGDVGHGERGRVRREDRLGPRDAVELGEELPLRAELLDDRLDHEVAVREVGDLGRRLELSEHGIAIRGRHAVFLDRAAQVVPDLLPRSLAELVADLATDHVMAGLEGDLRDSGAHRPQTDYSHSANFHRSRCYGKKTGRCSVL